MTCTCDSIAFVRVGDTILCCRCKQPVSLRPAVSGGVCNTVSGAAVSDKLVELEYRLMRERVEQAEKAKAAKGD